MPPNRRIINEDAELANRIQHQIEDALNRIAEVYSFGWLGPLHDIVRRLMNEVADFIPTPDEEED